MCAGAVARATHAAAFTSAGREGMRAFERQPSVDSTMPCGRCGKLTRDPGALPRLPHLIQAWARRKLKELKTPSGNYGGLRLSGARRACVAARRSCPSRRVSTSEAPLQPTIEGLHA